MCVSSPEDDFTETGHPVVEIEHRVTVSQIRKSPHNVIHDKVSVTYQHNQQPKNTLAYEESCICDLPPRGVQCPRHHGRWEELW
eukprot:9154707-Ditylum_brightwellii.AAC.1